MKKILIIALSLLLLPVGGWAADYYVKNGGNDSLPGTSDMDAWATISKINGRTFYSGDIVYLKRGDSWRGTQLIVPSSGMTIDAYGTGDKPYITATALITGSWTNVSGTYKTPLTTAPQIVFSDYVTLTQGSSPTTLTAQQWYWASNVLYVRLTGDANPTSHVVEWDTSAGKSYLCGSVIVNGRNNVTVRNLKVGIEWLSDLAAEGRGIVTQNSTGPIIEYNDVVGTKNQSVRGILAYTSPGIIMRYNTVNYAMYCIQVDLSGGTFTATVDNNILTNCVTGPASDWDGIKIGRASLIDGTGITIKNNDISAFAEDGIDSYYAQNVVIENNYIHDQANSGSGGTGIKTMAAGVVIRYNHIKNINSYAHSSWGINANGLNNKVYNNLVENISGYGGVTDDVGVGQGVKWYNNTIVGTWTGFSAGHGATPVLRNNILDGSEYDIYAYGIGTAITGSNNIFVKHSGPTLASGSTYTPGTGDQGTTDPLFVSSSDFRLQVGSPARNSGLDVGLTQDILGNTITDGSPDIGAYEYTPDQFAFTDVPGAVPPPVLSELFIDCPSPLNEGESGVCTATALWGDGSMTQVSPAWSEGSPYASIGADGLLTTTAVSGDQPVTVTADYTSAGVTRTASTTVMITDLSDVTIMAPSDVNVSGPLTESPSLPIRLAWDPVASFTDGTPIPAGTIVDYSAYWTTDSTLSESSLKPLASSTSSTSVYFDPTAQGMNRNQRVYFTTRAEDSTGKKSHLSAPVPWKVSNAGPSPPRSGRIKKN